MLSFPRTHFVDRGGILNQIDHTYSEVCEALEAALTPEVGHTAEEIFDIIHSAETALRIMQESHGVDLTAAYLRVIEKNRERGYYGILS